MWEYNYTNELYHYGVKGMRWGVRRAKKKAIKTLKRYIKEEDEFDKSLKDAIETNMREARAARKRGDSHSAEFFEGGANLAKLKLKMYGGNSAEYKKLLKDIDDNTMQLGRDYIVKKNPNSRKYVTIELLND